MPTTPSSSHSSALALPTGCSASDFGGPNRSGTMSGGFTGCVVGVASVLQTCCTSVGSTPAFVNNTCGCPIDPVLLPNAFTDFGTCVGEHNDVGACGPLPSGGTGRFHGQLRWNAAAVVLGVTFLVGLML
ncbi:hypothetical protein B0H19DRAFT_1138580 [Mycena capillaripes]|nr:hypothetical protein B0H19DRAFT_1138580 [Mycena capillaripes]